MVPSKILKLPSTSETVIWVTVNLTLECPLSTAHLVTCAMLLSEIKTRAEASREMVVFFI